MGYVMEVLYARDGAPDRNKFLQGLQCLRDRTAWTSGVWRYAEDDIRPWNSIQNVNRQIVELTHHLIRIVKSPSSARVQLAGIK
jgi:hypothetical protein